MGNLKKIYHQPHTGYLPEKFIRKATKVRQEQSLLPHILAVILCPMLVLENHAIKVAVHIIWIALWAWWKNEGLPFFQWGLPYSA